MTQAIGIDVGVTNVKAVRVTPAGEVTLRETFPTGADSPEWPKRVKAGLVERFAPGADEPIGVAAPGIARADSSAIHWMQGRLGEVEGLDWTRLLERSRPVPVLNDAQAALLGEVWLGAARGAQNAVLLTLGTGVGGAILCDGRILKGHIGRAGHLGHISLDVDGPLDVVRTPGSLEHFVGNCTIGLRSNGRFATTHELVAAYKAGNADAKAVWLRSVRALAVGIASIINAVDPETVILGGGIAAGAGAELFDPLNEYLDRIEWRPHEHRVRIVPAALGEWAGALGAARNAMVAHAQNRT
jgi:glucokinase